MYKGLLLVPCLLATVHSSTWNPSNCGPFGYVVGNVTDALCSSFKGCAEINNGTYGSTNAKVQACDNNPVCLWNTETATCGMNRDRKNNVCIPFNDDGSAADINVNCHDLTQGYCPLKWQVKRGCCTGNAAKYDGILTVRSQNVTLSDGVTINFNQNTHMCCNTPCEQLTANRVSQPDLCLFFPDHNHLTQCGPAGRSAFVGGDMGDFQMPELGQDLQLPPDVVHNMFGMNPGKQMSFGIANEGFGFTGMSPQMGVNSLESIGVGQSKDHHTEEITVDDIMDVLIESLSKDKDVFDYNREINSDPWFQKQAFGGFTDKFSFIDPWKFISQIYGTPFGMSQASTTYGQMYGLDRSKFGNAAPGFENPYQTMMTGGMGAGFGAMGAGAGGMGGGLGGMGGGLGGMGGGLGGMSGGLGGMSGGVGGMGSGVGGMGAGVEGMSAEGLNTGVGGMNTGVGGMGTGVGGMGTGIGGMGTGVGGMNTGFGGMGTGVGGIAAGFGGIGYGGFGGVPGFGPGFGPGYGPGFGHGFGGGYGGHNYGMGGKYGGGNDYHGDNSYGNNNYGGSYGNNDYGMGGNYGNSYGMENNNYGNYGNSGGYGDDNYGMDNYGGGYGDSGYGNADGGSPHMSTNDYTYEKK